MTQRTCPECSAAIVRRSPRGPLPTYCSRSCKERRYYRETVRPVLHPRACEPAQEDRTCPRCGIRERGTQTYCPECFSAYRRARRAAKTEARDCLICGAEYRSPYPHTLTCSKPCGRERERRLLGVTALPIEPRECPVCQARFTMNNNTHEYCSRRCKQIGIGHTRLRRARIGATTIKFTVAQRASKVAYWGDKCWMCGDPATSIDHVKPLIAGGPHILANLRPACRSCNSSKGGRWFGVHGLERFKAA